MEPTTLIIVGIVSVLGILFLHWRRHQQRQAEHRALAAAAEVSAGQANRKKRKKKPKAPEPEAPAVRIPETWGWAKVHWAQANVKALGYYYRDATAGPSFKILVDLFEVTDDAAIRDAAKAKDYIANETFRLGAHVTSYAGARDSEEGRRDTEA